MDQGGDRLAACVKLSALLIGDLRLPFFDCDSALVRRKTGKGGKRHEIYSRIARRNGYGAFVGVKRHVKDNPG